MKRFPCMLVMVAACGGGGGSHTDAPLSDGKVFQDARVFMDAKPVDAKIFTDAPAGTVPLTVKNFENWCTVTVTGGHATSDPTVFNVDPGTIAVSAKANDGFELSSTMWHLTAGDTGSGEAGTVTGSGSDASSATTVSVSSAKCVWVCCPFSPSGSGCNVADQCP